MIERSRRGCIGGLWNNTHLICDLRSVICDLNIMGCELEENKFDFFKESKKIKALE